MASIRSIDFLPEIFRTKTNEQFLESTLDQLIREPKIKKIQGYIGHRTGPGISSDDSYIEEIDDTRQNYQLEPGIVFKDQDGDPVDAITYPGLLNSLNIKNANTDDHNRLFASEIYSWAPLIDFDKFINYSQYYWLPEGPDSVDVSAITDQIITNFIITRDVQNDAYTISNLINENPTITIIRGNTYQFTVDQLGHAFWIQADSNINGSMSWAENISSREILGVVNNGEDDGVITFNVPDIDAQLFYDEMTDIGDVDLATTMAFNEINHQLLSDIETINGIGDLDNKTIVFVDNQSGTAEELGWINEHLEDSTVEYYETNAERYRIWRIDIIDHNGDDVIDLIPIQSVNEDERFTIQYGPVYSNISFFKNSEGYFEQIPLITASLDRLYYCDADNSNMVGIIDVIDESEEPILDIEDILGQTQYTSPNGVIFTNGLKVKFRDTVEPTEYVDHEYYVAGVGDDIQLLPVGWFVTPESYTENLNTSFDEYPFDSNAFDASLNAPLNPDYITINRASQDRNPWSRSNRWVHVSVIEATSNYNNTPLLLDQDYRAKRPIIEFESNIQLYNFGIVAKNPINIIDFNQTDALSNVHGALGYSTDGYSLSNGSRIVFAADHDENVQNKIYEVAMIDLADEGQERIVLTEAEDAEIVNTASILVLNGNTLAGTTYMLIDGVWRSSQAKTSINQQPLFDIFDDTGESFSNTDYYPESTFVGSKLFSYVVGDGVADNILGFALEYLSINNLGDIQFENNLYVDTFTYVQDSEITKLVSDGFVKQYTSGEDYNWKIGWEPSAELSYVPQIFNFISDGTPLILDVIPITDLNIQTIKVFVDNTYLTSNQYSIEYENNNTIITINSVDEGASIEISIISDQVSQLGYYQVPDNLTRNVFNENSERFTLGIIRNHYNQLTHNLPDFEGEINGSNNIRDLGKIAPYGDLIIQNAAPIVPIAYFIRNDKHNFFQALKFNSQQYEKIKNQILNWIEKNELYDWTASQILEKALAFINVGKSPTSAFYNTDMMPYGTNYIITHHEVTAISTDTFVSYDVYDFTEANTKGLLVYHNDELLIKDLEYTIADDGPRVTILIDLEIGDTIDFYEYLDTRGSYIPATPTKLGLYPSFYPIKFEDNTYLNPRNVIRGHDGSLIVAFNDIRDDVLLEFEKRIFNNIKVDQNFPLEYHDVVPGQFRDTDYSYEEIINILSPLFLSWVGWNRLDYRHQDYRSNNSFTWNYSSSSAKLDNAILKGHWRGIYEYYYDTTSPDTRPWEMLGFTKQPTWWETRYGPAPYTSGNLILWEDIANGTISDPSGSYIDERYIRPDLLNVLPVDGEGNLRNPIEVVVGTYSSYNFISDWQVGDQGPVETAWRRSSSWPFAVQQLLALTKPAKYFTQYIDRDRYVYNDDLQQFVYDNRYRFNFHNTEIKSNTLAKHSYINWVIDYAIHYGYNSRSQMIEELNQLDVNLCYRMAGFTDKNKLKIFTDASSPDSTSASLLYPDESYDLLLYKNQPYDEISYSSVIIQRQANGYVVYGNSISAPYFKVMRSIPSNNSKIYSVGRTDKYATKIRVPTSFSDTVVYIPYGYIFTNKHAVVDFLVSYGEYLNRAGIQYNEIENSQDVDWITMAKEFIYWDNQGWGNSSIINLNPNANVLEFERQYMIVENLLDLSVQEQPQDQNKHILNSDEYVIERIQNNFKIEPLDNRILAYLTLQLVNYEHLLILDNTSIFNDIMYDPITGIRQNRIRLHGYLTDEWNGQLDTQGFIFSADKIPSWNYTKTYNKGSIVEFKNSYWVALTQVPESYDFNFDYWIKIDKDNITTGLLPNLATKSDQMIQFYDNKTANLESDADLLALGLTGFRPRDYLSGLDLDDISQVNIYLDMIKQKGTIASMEMFNGIELSGEKMEYDILENWAIQRAQYGATSSRAYFELQLDADAHRENPSIIKISDSVDNIVDQVVAIDDIYKQSVKHTSTNLIPLLDEDTTDIGLPYAGFVDYNDVDLYTYDALSIDDIELELDNIINGTLIWVANDRSGSWNVYRTVSIEPTLGNVYDNLNGTLTLEFNGDHGLIKSDIIIIKYHDDILNKAHHVATVENRYKIQILGSLNNDQSVIEDETGMAFKLVSVKVENPSDIADTIFNNQLFANDKIWVNDYNGLARIYEKQNVFVSNEYLENPSPIDSTFGCSIAQGKNYSGAVVGDDTHNLGHGIIHGYNREDNEYTLTTSLQLLAVDDVTNYGSNLAMSETVVIASAKIDNEGILVFVERDKNSNTYVEQQIIPASSTGISCDHSSFGNAIALSANEKWLYVGEPNVGLVHSYQLINYETQTITFIGDGSTAEYDLDDYIAVDNGILGKSQLIVTINGSEVSNYTITGTKIIFDIAPIRNKTVVISRRNELILISPDVTHPTVNPSADSDVIKADTTAYTADDFDLIFSLDELYAVDGIDSFSVFYDDEILVPEIDFTFNSITNELYLHREPESDDTVITVKLNKFYRYVGTTTSPIGSDTIGFGSSIATSEKGDHVIIGNPFATVNGIVDAGESYTYEKIVERIVIENNTQTFFNIQRTVSPYSIVWLNGIELTSNNFNAVPQYEANGSTIELIEMDIAVGDYLDIETNYPLMYVETLIAEEPQQNAYFGYDVDICRSKCSAYIGAPGSSTNKHNSGAVIRHINSARINNVLIGDIQNPTVIPSDSIRINNIEVIFTGTSVEDVSQDITTALTPNVRSYVDNGYLIIELKNTNVRSLANRLTVMPGFGTAFDDLGLHAYNFDQHITAPEEQDFGNFGNSIYIDYNMNQLYVSANKQSAKKIITFDDGETTFDGDSTRIIDEYYRSGVVYTYDWLPDATDYSAGKFVYGEQIYDTVLNANDGFGQSISVVDGLMLVSSPGFDETATDGSSVLIGNEGRVAIFINETNDATWTVYKESLPNTDVSMINSVFIYDKETEQVKEYLDFLDPLNGGILSAARQNIDYIRSIDPANYSSTVTGPLWGKAQVGYIWWDTTSVKFLDYFQEDVKQSTKRWGKVFPGSYIDVYQWIESDKQPLEYTGDGTPLDTDKYIALDTVDNVNGLVTKYYFWVKNAEEIPIGSNKSLSTNAIAGYIESPKSSGIPYIVFIKPNVFGLFNVQTTLTDDCILHIEYDTIKNDNNVFVEYELIHEGDGNDMLHDEPYQKLLDSFCGVDSLGNVVPDTNLSLTDRYGVTFRPRKSMFKDRFAALSSYIQRVNRVLLQYPIAELKIYSLLEDVETIPAANSGSWDEQVNDTTELLYQNLALVPTGWRYLVLTDYDNNGYWTIYEVTADDELELIQVQSYDTTDYWNFIDWYDTGYTSDIQIDEIVDTYSELDGVVAIENMICKVKANSNNKWELYIYTAGEWNRIALQDGTIEISSELYNSNATEDSSIETRNIIRSINEELLINDLALERNAALISIFKYVLSEQKSIEWLFKTSLIDVSHKVRTLEASPIYQKESQDLVLDYINESKPYHTKIKDFRLKYDALDIWEGDVTDFDCPAYYDVEYSQFVSPILDDGAILITDVSNRDADNEIWQLDPWKDWYDNYYLVLDSIEIINSGSGYTSAPDIIITGDIIESPKLTARIATNGELVEVIIDDAGSGYISTPIITFSGGGGTGAVVKAVMKNDLVRSFKTTVKYDRYEYTSSVLLFEDTVDRVSDDLIRYNNVVYRVLEDNSDLTFIPSKYEEVDVYELSGIDRTQGYYVPNINAPGLNLALLINGIDFPGVQVDGVSFDQSSGFDGAAWDSDLFDNIVIGEEGWPTYSDDLLDTIYQSSYYDTDYDDSSSYLGTRPTDINIDGAGYVDVYHSHAPEELIPGSTFDTLDITVFTRPGADYIGDGHGFAISTKIEEYTGDAINFDGIVTQLIGIIVFNLTTKTHLYETINYTIDWQNLEFQCINGVNIGDVIKVYAYEIGGGDQLIRKQLRGSNIDNNTYQIQANIDEIDHVVIFINGEKITNFVLSEIDTHYSTITFDGSVIVDDDDFITITVFGINSEFNESYWRTFIFEDSGPYELPDGELNNRNRMNAIVEVNGLRLRPPEARRYFSDGSSDSFNLPNDGDINQILISDNEVFVYVDDIKQQLGIDYTVSSIGDLTDSTGEDYFFDPDEAEARYITFVTPPDPNTVIDVYCTTDAEYHFDGNELVLDYYTPDSSSIVAVTVFGDTAELQVITEVFRGPTLISEDTIDTFDSHPFDELSFDLLEGQTIAINIFGLDQIQLENPERLWVTLNGEKLNANNDYYIIEDNRLAVGGDVLEDTDVLAVTSMTKNVVHDGISFKYFKDMRDNSVMYAVGPNHETYLTVDLELTDDEIYIADVSKITPPNLEINEFGIVMINGERITFRELEIDTDSTSITTSGVLRGLRRGTAGTSINPSQLTGSIVRDVSKSVMIPDTFVLGGAATFIRYDQPETAVDIIPGGRYIIQSVGTTDFTLIGAASNDVGEEFVATDFGDGDGLVELLGWSCDADVMHLDVVKRVGILSCPVGDYGTIKIDGLDGYLIKFTDIDFNTNLISGLSFIQYDLAAGPIPDYIESGSLVYDMARDRIWYEQGETTPSNGIPLNDQTTLQVLFISG